jgi:dTDP-4-amino-4,6-dideoxygalactose transaminase
MTCEKGIAVKQHVPVFRPKLPNYDALQKYLRRIDTSQIYSNFGPLVEELESRLAGHFDVPRSTVASASSATLALEGAIATSNSLFTSPIHLPSWTFTATAAAVARSRRVGRFCDVNMDGEVNLPVNYGLAIRTLPFGLGFPVQTPESPSPLIVDAAASFDALSHIHFPERRPEIAVISLHATKCLPAGEGAILVSNDPDWIQRFRRWTNFGMWGSRTSEVLGTNAKLSEYAAAVALASLDEWPQARVEWVASMDRASKLSDLHSLAPHKAMRMRNVSPYWVVKCESKSDQQSLKKFLEEHGIAHRQWWESGCHRMPAYMDFDSDQLPITELLADSTLGLPLYREMSESTWDRIASALDAFTASR